MLPLWEHLFLNSRGLMSLEKGTSERVCLDGQLCHRHTGMFVGLRVCLGTCVSVWLRQVVNTATGPLWVCV